MKTGEANVSPAIVRGWWQKYIALNRKDKFLRDRLIEKYLAVVKKLAKKFHKKLPEAVDIDDLISAGIFGLINAINGFELERGVKFETYCTRCVNRAMIDELRNMDWAPRSARSRSRKLNKATRVLQSKLSRKPTHEELARHMKLSAKEFRRIERGAFTVCLISLSQKISESNSGKDVLYAGILEDKRIEVPMQRISRKLLRRTILNILSEAERNIIVLYYFKGMQMKEIGKTLGCCKSRVSQIHGEIIKKLARCLNGRKDEFLSKK